MHLNQCLLYAGGLYLTFAFGMFIFCYNDNDFSKVSMDYVMYIYVTTFLLYQAKLYPICSDNDI